MRINMSGPYRSYEGIDATDCLAQTRAADGIAELRTAMRPLHPAGDAQ